MRTTYSTTRTIQKGQSNQRALLGLLLNIDLLDPSLPLDYVRVLLYMHANGFEQKHDNPTISRDTRIPVSSLYSILRKLEEKTGVKLDGVWGINPVNGQQIPIFISDYVLATYGTGAIMAVPGHDQRDGGSGQDR